jgi:hypothetical protein
LIAKVRDGALWQFGRLCRLSAQVNVEHPVGVRDTT